MPCLSKLWSWEQSDEEETIVLPPQHPIEEIDLQLDPQQESIENLMDENFTDIIEDKGDKCNMIAGFCITHNRDIEDCVHEIIIPYASEADPYDAFGFINSSRSSNVFP